jgi:hypothetical protein
MHQKIKANQISLVNISVGDEKSTDIPEAGEHTNPNHSSN